MYSGIDVSIVQAIFMQDQIQDPFYTLINLNLANQGEIQINQCTKFIQYNIFKGVCQYGL